MRTRNGALDELTVEVEVAAGVQASGQPGNVVADELATAFRERLAVRIPTRVVPAGSLPRWELKAKRVVDARGQ